MKNIKNSIFLSMIVVTSVSAMEEISPIKPIITAMSNLQDMILSIDQHQREQQRATEVHQQQQQIQIENHQLNQQIVKDNHKTNQQEAKDHLRMNNEYHETNQQEAKLCQQIDRDNHEADQRSMIDNQLSNLQEQRRKNERYEANRWVTFHENQTKIASAQAKLKEIEDESAFNQGENAFRRCLINNRHSSDLGSSKIPKVCEDSAKVLRLLGGSSIVDELIEDFQK